MKRRISGALLLLFVDRDGAARGEGQQIPRVGYLSPVPIRPPPSASHFWQASAIWAT